MADVPLTSDAPGLFQGSADPVQWGIFLNGAPVVIADSVAAHEFKEDFALSDYPVERGGFQTFNKVYVPFDARFRFATGGSVEKRSEMLASITAIIGDLNFYDIVTPEIVFLSANLTHMDYKRTNDRGNGLMVVDVWALEVRQVNNLGTGGATDQPSGASQVNGGDVQSTPPTPGAMDAAVNDYFARNTPVPPATQLQGI